MSRSLDQIEKDQSRPITYTINIKSLSTSKRPVTCSINTKHSQVNQLNTIKSLKNAEKSRSTIHLPVTYSTSIHVPCHPSTRSPLIPPSSSTQHHHHHYHHHYYYHHHHHSSQRQSLPLSSHSSTTIKSKFLPRSTSLHSNRPLTTMVTTPDSSSSTSLPQKTLQNHISTLPAPKKQISPPPPPPLPSYSTLVWNWFHHSPSKTLSPHKDSQSEYSEICHHDRPSKCSLLFKFLTSSVHKTSKTKSHRPCFTRKRFQSSSSLPTKPHLYTE